jgi:hypothetical protein
MRFCGKRKKAGILIGLRKVEASIISRKLAHESSRVFGSTTVPILTPRGYPSYGFLLVDPVRPEGLGQFKIPINPGPFGLQ